MAELSLSHAMQNVKVRTLAVNSDKLTLFKFWFGTLLLTKELLRVGKGLKWQKPTTLFTYKSARFFITSKDDFF